MEGFCWIDLAKGAVGEGHDAASLIMLAHLRQQFLVDCLPRFWRQEIVTAPIRIKGRKKAPRQNRLGQAAKTRGSPLLLAKKDRRDRAGGVVHGHDHVQVRAVGEPGMGRAILKQHNARQGSPLTLAPVNPAPGRLRRQTSKLKHALGPGVGTSKRLPARHRHTHDLFVEVFDPKAEIMAAEHLRHPYGLHLVSARALTRPRRRSISPSSPRSSKASRKRRKWRSLNPRSSPASTQLKRPARCELIASKTRAIRTSGNMRPSDPKTGQTTCYLNRTYHVLATHRSVWDVDSFYICPA